MTARITVSCDCLIDINDIPTQTLSLLTKYNIGYPPGSKFDITVAIVRLSGNKNNHPLEKRYKPNLRDPGHSPYQIYTLSRSNLELGVCGGGSFVSVNVAMRTCTGFMGCCEGLA